MLPSVLFIGACSSSCTGAPPCDEPRLWYSPQSNEEVHFGCEPPGPGWREDPFVQEVGVDLDGRLRGPAGVFLTPTADTGVLGPLPPLKPSAPRDTAPVDFGPTADTGFVDTGFVDTGFPDTGFTEMEDTGRIPRVKAPRTSPDTGELPPESDPDATGLTADTGGPFQSTGATADTGFIETGFTGDTGLPLLGTAGTADTGTNQENVP